MSRIEVGKQMGDEQPRQGSPLGAPPPGDTVISETLISETAAGDTVITGEAARTVAGEAPQPGAPAAAPEAQGAPPQDGGQSPPQTTEEAAPPVAQGPGRATTIVLVVALVVTVVMSGVLGAVAVLMTRNSDAPPLSHVSLRRLQTPMIFKLVTGVHTAPCPTGDGVVLDDKGTTCYQLDPGGVTVSTVQKIEQVAERDGTYSVRIVLAPATMDQIARLTHDTVDQQLAIVVGQQVVAAPRVAQEITQDSLGIANYSKEQAAALVAVLTGAAPVPPPAQQPAPQQGQPQQGQRQGQPQQGQQGGVNPGVNPGVDPGGLNPGGTGGTGTGVGGTGTGGTGTGGTGGTGVGGTGTGGSDTLGTATSFQTTSSDAAGQTASGGNAGGDPQFNSCKQARDQGYGPYTKGRHPEYAWYEDVDKDGVACDPGDM